MLPTSRLAPSTIQTGLALTLQLTSVPSSGSSHRIVTATHHTRFLNHTALLAIIASTSPPHSTNKQAASPQCRPGERAAQNTVDSTAVPVYSTDVSCAVPVASATATSASSRHNARVRCVRTRARARTGTRTERRHSCHLSDCSLASALFLMRTGHMRLRGHGRPA